MKTDAFDFELPDELIALRPAEPRGAARLLLVDGLSLIDTQIGALPQILHPGDMLVLNDTRVIPARLFGRRTARQDGAPPASIEILLHRRLNGESYEAFARPGKRLRIGDIVSFDGLLEGRVAGKGEDGLVTLEFNLSGAALDAAIAQAGEMPLPPYIAGKRKADGRDRTDYQTVYAQKSGAVAAPTAGLHFTPQLLAALDAQGISHVFVTLHVGAGTFLPVKAQDTADHVMHAEWGEISRQTADALNAARAQGRRIVAIGTTSLRILESACDRQGVLHAFAGETRIFITPGTPIYSADLLFTNFHLPRSTLFMLVQAFGGVEALRAAYAHAIEKRYRFYSYGDACLIAKAPNG